MCIKTENYAATESEFVSMVYTLNHLPTSNLIFCLSRDSVPQKHLIVSPGMYDSVIIFFSKQIDKVKVENISGLIFRCP